MTVREPHNNSSRVEREIREILEKAEVSVTPIDRISSSVRRRPKIDRPQVPATISLKNTPEAVRIIASLALSVLAATLAGASHLLGVALAIASLLVLFSLWMPPRSAGLGERPRWRGRDVGDNPRLSGWNGGSFRPRNVPRQPRR